MHARKIPLAPDADLDAVAALTAGLSGADLANLLNEAALLAVRGNQERVGRVELDEAIERTLTGLSRRSRALNAEEKQRVALHEAGHALVALRLPGADPVRKVSVLPRGVGGLGFTLQMPTEDHRVLSEHALEDRIAVAFGGRVAERLTLGQVSTGAQDDLARATDLARAMVRAFGMSEKVGPVSLDRPAEGRFLRGPGAGEGSEESEAVAQQADAEVRRILEEQEGRVTQMLSRELPMLKQVAERLVERESLTGEELVALVGEPKQTSLSLVPLPKVTHAD